MNSAKHISFSTLSMSETNLKFIECSNKKSVHLPN